MGIPYPRVAGTTRIEVREMGDGVDMVGPEEAAEALAGPDQIGRFMKPWKRCSSAQIKRPFRGTLSSSGGSVDLSGPVWQARHDDFHLFSARKGEEKWIYVHQDPVRAG